MDHSGPHAAHGEDRAPPAVPATGPHRLLDSLRWARLRLVLRAEDAVVLPPYAGSTFRGAFGHAFKRVACPLRRQCEGCAHRAVCVYAYVFETPGQDGGSPLARGSAVAHPFILEPPPGRAVAAGQALELGLVLVGGAIALAPYFLAACREMAARGLGRGRGGCRLERAVAEDPEHPGGRVVYEAAGDLLAPAVPSWSAQHLGLAPRPAPGRVTLEFLTPTRLRQGADLVVRPEFATLATALLRRLSVLAEVHCGARPDADARLALRSASAVVVQRSDLRWHDWERYSARQGARMALGGFVGRITFAGDLDPWWALLRLGEVLHVGKGTSFGLGRYRLASGDCPSLPARPAGT